MISNLTEKTQALVVSYIGIRRAVGVSGLLLPIVLGPIGWLVFGIDFQDNMSSYYHTPLRDVFVGTMCGIGIFLYCYRGHDAIENWTANVGCVSALVVALCPLDAHSDPLHQRSWTGYAHTFGGGVFFMTLATYSLLHFPTTKVSSREEEPHEAERNFIYRTSGIVILLSTLAMGAYLVLLPVAWKDQLTRYHFLFWMEWIALWAFAAAWLTKGRTIVAELAVELLAIPVEMLKSKSS